MAFFLAELEHESEEVSEILRLQSLVRIISYALLLASLILRIVFKLYAYSYGIVIILVGVALLANMALLWASQERVPQVWRERFISLQSALDIVFISALVYFSGGIQSKLGFLYLLPCVSAALFSLRSVLRVSLSALAAYAAIVSIDFFNIGPTIQSSAYSVGQVATLNVIRVGLSIAIVVLIASLFIVQIMKRAYQKLNQRDEALFTIAGSLTPPLERTAKLLRSLQLQDGLPPATREEIRGLESEIGSSLAAAKRALDETDESAPFALQTNVHKSLACNVCGKSIGLFERYWAIPLEYLFAHDLGSYPNDIHCTTCHAANGSLCHYCAAWVKPSQAASS